MIEIHNIKPAKVLVFVLTVLLISWVYEGLGIAESPTGVNVLVEGKPLAMTVPATIVEGRTLVGVRFVGEAVGGAVEWDPVRQQATVVRRSDTVVLTLGKREALVNGKSVIMEVPAQLIDSRTMVPLRFIAEALGGKVEWDAVTRTANILRKPTEITGLTYTRDSGQSRITLQLSEPLATVQPQVSGNALGLRLYPAVIKVSEPSRLLYDSLLKLISLQADGRTVQFQAQTWNPPKYRYHLSEDGTLLTVEFDYTISGIQFHMDGRVPEVTIAADGKLNYGTSQLDGPPRLVFDMAGAHFGAAVPSALKGAGPLVAAVRTGRIKVGEQDTARVVLDLAKSHPVDIASTDLGLQVRFMPSLWAVRTEKLPGVTRLHLPFSLPIDASVTAAAPRSISIEVPQGRSALKENLVKLADGTIDTVSVVPGAQKDSLRITVSLPYYLGHKVISKNGDAGVIVDLITSPVYGRRIWIDAGHGKIPGGKDDPGSIGTTYRTKEKDINLAIALELQRLLQNAGATVHMTRTGNEGVNFPDRPRLVNAVKPAVDIFLSIHHNSAASPTARGIETYYWTTNPKSRRLAEVLHPAIVKGLGFPDRRVRMESFTVIQETLAPAVLLELGYLSNAAEEKVLADKGYPLKAAEAIKNGVFSYFGQ